MASRMGEMSFVEEPKFIKLLEARPSFGGGSEKNSNVKDIIEDVFNVSVERGLSDGEFSLLLNFLCKDSLGMRDKLKLLQNLVPEKKAPAAAIRQFMVWFITRFLHKREVSFSETVSAKILQWIIGLMEHNLVDSDEINNFYFDLYELLEHPSLVPYAAKLLCKLTKPDDVTSQTVRMFYSKYFNDPSNKYQLAVLNVFKGYKPHLVVEDVKKVDVQAVLKSVSQTMDSVMKVRVITARTAAPAQHNRALGIREIPSKNVSNFTGELNRMSSLIPLPTYNLEGIDRMGACYPSSVEEAFRKFSRIPIPQNILSLLNNDAGFFTIMYQGIEVQMRFQNRLLQTLQNALIYQELKTTPEDVELLFNRVHSLQTFMQQGIPSVSIFLSGYLLDWDGVDHRCSILKLIEWATFHSFRELACNILRPLHMLFVTNSVTMRSEIIQTLINLIGNMFLEVRRVQRRLPFPFLRRGARWTRDPEPTLRSLIRFTESLITLGLAVEPPASSALLYDALRFYEMINTFEADSNLRLFTIVPEGVVMQSLLSQSPNTIITICRLLLRYHKVFLPQLRLNNPRFYEQCREKIGLTSNYAQRIIYFLQNGQVVLPRKENGIIIRDVPNESLATGIESFSVTTHTCLVATYVLFESQKNCLDLLNHSSRMTSLGLAARHLSDIAEFIDCFSPSNIPEAMQ